MPLPGAGILLYVSLGFTSPPFAPSSPKSPRPQKPTLSGCRARYQTVDWSGLPCEARFWERKMGPAKAHYL